MNRYRPSFEAVCSLAEKEDWCWNLNCTTCGCMQFRYAFRELVDGKTPEQSGWTTRKSLSSVELVAIGAPAGSEGWSHRDQRDLAIRLSESRADFILEFRKFPDALGYLGVALNFTRDSERQKNIIARRWAPALAAFLDEESRDRQWLRELGESGAPLTPDDLDRLETPLGAGVARAKARRRHAGNSDGDTRGT